jgi:hypothetical protein
MASLMVSATNDCAGILPKCTRHAIACQFCGRNCTAPVGQARLLVLRSQAIINRVSYEGHDILLLIPSCLLIWPAFTLSSTIHGPPDCSCERTAHLIFDQLGWDSPGINVETRS